ncbi:MAG: DUF4349 domain-containing protein [Chloroflexi bacterium]|nr:DUF4349 domain-containing protein [Chloroflexota bacterium]
MRSQVRRPRFAVVVALSLLAMVAAGCAAAPWSAPAESPQVREEFGSAPMPMSAPTTAAAVDYEREKLAADAANQSAVSPQRMIVKTARLSLTVQDTAKAAEDAQNLATSLGGFVATSQTYYRGDQLAASMTLRVPADRFETAVQEIKALAVRVENETLGGQDVTEEYVDLEARLRNLELTEKELQQLLTEVRERTSKAEDVMAVYRELVQIRGEIEQTKGRMQYLERSVGLATIDLELTPHELTPRVTEKGWQPLVTLRDSSRSLVRALQGLGDLVIWFVVFLLPVLLILAIPVALLVLLVRYLSRRRKRQS